MNRFSIILLFLVNSVTAQEFSFGLDSLIRRLDEVEDDTIRFEILESISEFSHHYSVDTALYYDRILLRTARKLNDPFYLSTAYGLLGNKFTRSSNYDSAKYYLSLSGAIARENNFDLSMNLISWGVYYEEVGSYANASRSYLKALEIMDSLHLINPEDYSNTSNERAVLLNNLANVYAKRGNETNAIIMYEKAFNIGWVTQDIQMMAMTSYNIGDTYMARNLPDTAFFYFKRSLRYCEEGNDYFGLALNNSQIAAYNYGKKDYQAAIDHYSEAIDIFYSIENRMEALECIAQLALVYESLGQYDKVHELASEVYNQASNNKLSDGYILATHLLSKYYQKQGDLRKALTFQREYSYLNDSLVQIIYDREVLELEKILETERKEKEAETLALEKEKQAILYEEELRQQRNTQNALASGLLVLFIITGLIYWFYRSKKKINKLLNQKNRDLEELSIYKQGLTHLIAHDMKNPLNVVLGLSEGIPDELMNREINQSGKLMLQMVNNMLDVQKYDDAKMQLNLSDYNLLELIYQSKNQVELLIEARQIQFEVKVGPDDSVLVDSDVFIRILVNLFSNAIKYNQIGGRLTVSACQKNDRVFVEVSDTGKGIPKEDLPHVFDKFWQTDARRSGQIRSTGLGLTFCKMAVEAHDGLITVSSTEGQKTTFRFDVAAGESVGVLRKREEVINTFSNDVQTFSQQELEEIDALIEQIQKIPLYKFTLIQKELEKSQSTPAVQEWKRKVIDTATEWDQETYQQLVSVVGR